MRYLVASDLHYGLVQLDWILDQAGDFDAVVLSGDHLDVVGRAELDAQIAFFLAWFARLADRTTVFANSGNHDLSGRRDDGEKAALWLADADPRVAVDGATVTLGEDLVSVCGWWEGPGSRREIEAQLGEASARRGAGPWIWVYHGPPEDSPTSWSGSRHYGDDLLNAMIEAHQPDVVLTGHVHEAPYQDGGSWHDRIGRTLVCNAGRQGGPVPAHCILDTRERTVDWWTFEGQGRVEW